MAVEWIETTVSEAFEVNPPRPLKRGRVAPFIPMDALPVHARAVERIESREFTGSGTRFKNGDTLIARITPCLENGKTAFVAGLPDGSVGHGSTEYIVVAGKEKLSDRLFGYYLARSPDFRRYAIGHMEGTSGRQRVPSTAVEKYVVKLPPLPEQRAIAHILGTLDDKIELNRRRNQTLEAMARALFKDWFVDFGPVRARMEGSEPYLPADLWKLFPERLDDEGKPEGWEISPLVEVTTELRRGISPSYVESGGVRVLNQKCIRNREINLAPSRCHDHNKRNIEGREVKAGDILVNSTGVGTLGRTAQLWRFDEPTVVDSHVSVVRPNADIVSVYYLGLNLTGREAEIEALGEGSTGQTELSRVRLGSLLVLVPPHQVLKKFDAEAKSLLDAILVNSEENKALAQLRDTLLPKLISGELRIADTEKFLERVEFRPTTNTIWSVQ